MLFGNQASAGMKPTTPTIGTATDGGTGTTVSVAFTPSTYIGKGTITYTATSSPGSLTGTGSGSPITVSGLTTGTAYTFTVRGTTNYGVASDSSAASNSVTPASPTAFDSIATASGSGVSTITFSNIPQTYKSLQIRTIARNSSDGGSNAAGYKIRFNGDSTTNNYRSHYIQGDGATASASNNLDNGIFVYRAVARSASTASAFAVSIVDIIDYASSSKLKTLRAISGADFNNTNGIIAPSSGLYVPNTNAITSITIVNELNDNWASGTSFALYGVK